MSKKPSYVGALNAIANGERGGQEIFEAWAQATSDPKLQPVLERVAIREAEHAAVFAKRLAELGFPLRENRDPKLDKRVRLFGSDATDKAKFKALGIAAAEPSDNEPDRLLGLLSDRTIDPQTGALLGRFICEERASVRELRKARKSVKRRAKAGK